MPVEQFDTNFHLLSPAEFIRTLNTFADSLLNHYFFSKNWPDYLTHPLTLKEEVTAYHVAQLAAEADGGRKNLKERDDCREKAHRSAVFMSQYVIHRAFSENQPNFLDEVSLKRKVRAPKSSTGKPSKLSAPENLDLRHGRNPGEVVVSYGRVDGAGTYEILVCKGNPDRDEDWSVAGQFKTRRIALTGHEPGTRLFIKVRCHGTGDPGPFTRYESIIVT